jgi:hypothetical protein
MRRILAVALGLVPIIGIYSADGAERLRMIGPPPADETVRELMESVASSCNRRQFTDFMSHFTARRATAIRGRMEALFVQKDIMMEIMDVIVLMGSDQRIVFGVRYAWNDKSAPKQIIASKVTAVKVAGSWKIDGEKVQSTRVEANSATDSHLQRFEFGGAGVVALNPNDDLLPRDIPRVPGGCANGRCGL